MVLVGLPPLLLTYRPTHLACGDTYWQEQEKEAQEEQEQEEQEAGAVGGKTVQVARESNFLVRYLLVQLIIHALYVSHVTQKYSQMASYR